MSDDAPRRAPASARRRPTHTIELIEDHLGRGRTTALGRRIGIVKLPRKLAECQDAGKLEWKLADAIARELGVPLLEVAAAFAADVGLELSEEGDYLLKARGMMTGAPAPIQAEMLNALSAVRRAAEISEQDRKDPDS